MIVVTCHASVYTLVLLSFDRYLAVVHAVISMPYRNKFYTIVWVYLSLFDIISLVWSFFAHKKLKLNDFCIEVAKCAFLIIFFLESTNVWYYINNVKQISHTIAFNPYRVLITAWTIIIITGIPAGLAHGVVNYPYQGKDYTACLFLVDDGYNLVAFQVNMFLNIFLW